MKHLLLLACTMPLVAMDNAVIPVSNKLGALSIINKNGSLDYSIADRSVQRCDIYGPLKEISSEEQLDGFLANGGRINVSRMSNGEYILRSGIDIKGGGPILACAGYWLVKGVAYGVPFGLASTATVLSLPAAPVVLAGAAGGSGLTGIVTGTAVTMGTTMTATGLSATGTAIAATGAGTVAGTSAMAATGWCATVYAAGVETAATSLAGFLTTLPTP